MGNPVNAAGALLGVCWAGRTLTDNRLAVRERIKGIRARHPMHKVLAVTCIWENVAKDTRLRPLLNVVFELQSENALKLVTPRFVNEEPMIERHYRHLMVHKERVRPIMTTVMKGRGAKSKACSSMAPRLTQWSASAGVVK